MSGGRSRSQSNEAPRPDRLSDGNTPVSDADISIQPPATPRPLLPSMVTKYLDGGFLGSGPLTQY